MLATVVGLVVAGILSFALAALVLGALASSDSDKPVASNSVLELKLDKPITERQEPRGLGASSSIGLLNLRQAIAEAKGDGDIKG
ncbi:MAG: signal peptide peptidase SppA, partial [Hymenobacter sp.]